jgi:hypothetical protein
LPTYTAVPITPRPYLLIPPPTSPKAESDDETQEISAPNSSLDPRAGPFYSPSEGNPSPGVFYRITVTLSHYPGGDLIKTPEFVQSVTRMDVLDLTEFLQTWGGPHLYYHSQRDDIAIAPRHFDYSLLQESGVVDSNGESYVLPLFSEWIRSNLHGAVS